MTYAREHQVLNKFEKARQFQQIHMEEMKRRRHKASHCIDKYYAKISFILDNFS